MSKVQLIRFSPNHSVRVHHLQNRPPIFDWHAHDCYELIMLIGSSGTRFIGNDVSESKTNELILIPPLVSHTWDTESQAEDVVVVLFSHEFLNSSVPEFSQLFDWLRGLRQNVSLNLEHNLHEHAYINPLRKLKDSPPLERVIILLSLLSQLQSDCRENSAIIDHAPQSKISKLMAYLEGNNEKSLTHCAETMNMSTSTLKRWLKKDVNTTFTELYRHTRLKKAQNLLACTQVTIPIVAEQSGFSSVRAFNEAFKATFNTTPVKYRAQYKWRKERA
ncbi:AraC family transcriptional regulator [Vibrio sp. Of7-15]|uniref:helix-turn-helix transcriptional regulator n=1 Tax=Vibrio sp. Of7-15 TaxID=2724879 RepID=UPI001EF344ED|nr:AraC family transcriptional regulator [Vibrio sp. Of7-15]MCG7498313.1 AraC family transcriptional regulator [Vibrio sp. Of7-15]